MSPRDEDIEFGGYFPSCKECGCDVDYEECHECGGDGSITEDDGVNGPEDYGCGACDGEGGWLFCPECRAKRIREWEAEQRAKERTA